MNAAALSAHILAHRCLKRGIRFASVPTQTVPELAGRCRTEWLSVRLGEGQSLFVSYETLTKQGENLTEPAAAERLVKTLVGKQPDDVLASRGWASVLRLPLRTTALARAVRSNRKKFWVGNLPNDYAGCLPARLKGYDWLAVPVTGPIGSVTHHFTLLAIGRKDDGDSLVSACRPPEQTFGRDVTVDEAVAALTAALDGQDGVPIHPDSVRGSAYWLSALGIEPPLSVSA